jgi:hypothetical protein
VANWVSGVGRARPVERCLACEADRSGPMASRFQEHSSAFTFSRANSRDLPAVWDATPRPRIPLR